MTRLLIILTIIIFLLSLTTINLYLNLQTIQQKTNEQFSFLINQTSYLNSTLLHLSEENILLRQQLNNLTTELQKTSSQLNDLQNKLTRTHITYPTYNEVLNFIQEDDTDKIPFNETNYSFICTDYTNRFISNFRKKGFYACETILYFPNHQSHSIVAINTTDKGVIFIEPQNDQIIFNLRIGDNYCDYINQDCNWTILSIKHCFQHTNSNI